MPISVLDSHCTGGNVHIKPCFIKLANANDIRLELWNIVDTVEDLVLTVFAAEDDSAATLDLDHRSITETDCT
jgi:hypothetical protein